MAGIELINSLYELFLKNDVGKIIEMCSDDCKWEFTDKNVPYTGTWSKGDQNGRGLLDFFKCVGGAWGEKAEVIEMSWDNFKLEGNRITNDCLRRICTQDGHVINGKDQHVWQLSDDHKQIIYHSNNCLADKATYTPGANQAEQLAKLCWSLFGEGKTDAIIKHTQHEKAVFSLMQDGDQALAKKVPYAGRYTKGEMEKPFAAMQASWVMDDQFSFAPTSFEAKGDTCYMTAAMTANTKAGKKIQFDNEKHKCVTAPGPNGCLKVTSWDVTGASEAHAAGF